MTAPTHDLPPPGPLARLRRRLAAELHEVRARARAGGRRGMVLIITLLMMTMLAVLGSAAVMRTTSALRDGGAARLEQASFRVSEAGTMASVALAAQMQAGFEDFVEQKSRKLTRLDMGDALMDVKPGGSFGYELAAVGGVDFSTEVGQPDLSAAVPGYDAGRYCFRTFRMVTRSQLGSADAKTVRDMMVSGQTAIAAQMTVGPVPCGH